MEEIEVIEYDLNNVQNLAKKIVKIAGNELNNIAFFGELGTGKTTIVKHLCQIKNVFDQVSSPSFSLLNIYNSNENEIIYHFDLYRLKNKNEVFDIGFFEYVDSTHLCLIEWPQLVEKDLPVNTLFVYLEHLPSNIYKSRKITLKYSHTI